MSTHYQGRVTSSYNQNTRPFERCLSKVESMTVLAMAGLLSFTAIPANANTIHVPADQPTIQAGIDAALESDTVLVSSGTYTGDGNRDLDFGGKNLVLKSEEGPQATVIEGNGFSLHRGEDSTAVVDGFTVTKGATFLYGGGAVISGSSPTFRNCVFENNHAWASFSESRYWECNEYTEECRWVYYCHVASVGWGGAIACFNASPTFINCRFIGNSATYGGALYVTSASSPRLYNTVIKGNGASPFHSPIECHGYLDFAPAGRGGGVYCESGSTVLFDHCTIVGNTADPYDEIGGDNRPGHAIFNSGHATMSSCIVAFNGIWDAFPGGTIRGPATLSFSNVFGNVGGDWVSDIEDQANINGNISADPLFCDTASGDYRLDAASPCLPAAGSGGGDWIGALSVGCGDYVCGDVDWDGTLSLADLERLKDFYFFRLTDWFLPVPAADMDCNGTITLADIILLAGYVNGYGSSPCCTPPPKRFDRPQRGIESEPDD